MKSTAVGSRKISYSIAWEKVKRALRWIDEKPILQILVIGNLLNLVVEMLSRRSIIEGLAYLFSSALVFEYNALIIILTLSLSLLFKKKNFVLICVCTVWFALGVTNCVLLGFRTTPLAAIDFFILKSVWEIIGNYFDLWQIILLGAAIIACLTTIVILGIKFPKRKVRYVRAAGTIAVAAIVVLASTNLSLKVDAISDSFGNLADAYDEYGFAYCFSTSLIDRGIDEPEDYSQHEVDKILESIRADVSRVPIETPNVIFLQLESFFDVNYMKNLSFSKNPVPVFTQLKEQYSSGFLTVPSIGAGTANTEFEIISGMSLDYFGTGEYPYKTVLKEKTSETVAFDLKELGYNTHAIHNHSGTFYDRHKVYPNLGFDTFTSIEYMENVELNPHNWAKDKVLTGEILKSLESTENQDFVYAVSVQPHGKYPTEVIDETQDITVSGIEDEGRQIAFEYYVNQLSESDEFLGSLIAALSSYDEDVVLVLYGDHLPSFDISEEDVENGSIFQTEYVIWSNFQMNTVDRDLYAYQLNAYVMGRLGFDNGVLTKLHQRYSNNPNYLESLEILEYDMLYGEYQAYEGQKPYIATDMKMGTQEITVKDAFIVGDAMYITGSGFTNWSVVQVGEDKKETELINNRILKVSDTKVEEGETISVAQIGKDGEVLSVTNQIIF